MSNDTKAHVHQVLTWAGGEPFCAVPGCYFGLEHREKALSQRVADAEAERRTYLHGPQVDSQWRTCDDCNYDRHRCGGCGEWLFHGTFACGSCTDRIKKEEL